MKKLLIIAEQFYPYINANINCMYKIIDGLQKKDFSVSVLTVSYQDNLPVEDEYYGCKIYRIAVPEIDKVDKLLYRDKIINNKLLRLVRGGIGHFAFKYTDKLKEKRTSKISEKLIKENFDYILSIINPSGAHETAYNFVDEDMKWIMYNLDAFVFNYSYSGGEEQRRIQEEKWCTKAKAVINTFGIVQENERHSYNPYNGMKQLEIPLPNFEISRQENASAGKRQSGKIIMRYTGMFYSNIRRPDELMKILDKLDPEVYTVEFYGPCCDYVRLHFENLPKCLELKGSVSVEKCKELVDSTDVLINVGNLCPNQTPSKVFEYIASGKPIINFYSTEKDPSLIYFEKYPHILSIKDADSVEESDIRKFVSESGTVPVDEIRDIYKDYLREKVIDKIVSFIDEL